MLPGRRRGALRGRGSSPRCPTLADVTWLLTGGAGYIGAHIVRTFRDADLDIAVLDDLSTGYRCFVPDDVPLVVGSVADPVSVGRALDEHRITGVVHLAGLKYAGVSVRQPLRFYHANVEGMRVLLEAVAEREIRHLLFSSSCAWYGTPTVEVVGEDTPPAPESPYGESKVVSEWLLRNVARAMPHLRQTSLRYFNVVGSGPPELADHSPFNLFPNVLRAASRGEPPQIFGGDYPTRDGTCIRDYIHVVDLAEAHLAAARHLEGDGPVADAYNVGTGEGATVREVIERLLAGAEQPLQPVVQPRRAGDPARVIGDVTRIGRELGWRARFGLDDMVDSAWRAWRHQLAVHGGAPADGGRLLGELV